MTRGVKHVGPVLIIRCRQCSAVKDYRLFYRHPSGKHRRMPVCKDCHKSNVNANRELKAEHYRAYDRQRPMTPERLEQIRRYQRTPAGKKAHTAANRAWRLTHPENWAELKARSAKKLREKRAMQL